MAGSPDPRYSKGQIVEELGQFKLLEFRPHKVGVRESLNGN